MIPALIGKYFFRPRTCTSGSLSWPGRTAALVSEVATALDIGLYPLCVRQRLAVADIYPAGFQVFRAALRAGNQRGHQFIAFAGDTERAALEEGAAFGDNTHVRRLAFNLGQLAAALARV